MASPPGLAPEPTILSLCSVPSPRVLSPKLKGHLVQGVGVRGRSHTWRVCGGTKVEMGGREQVCEEVYSTARGVGGCC